MSAANNVPKPSSPHECPGGCGRRVDRIKFACSRCWYRLPVQIRSAISRSYRLGDGPAHRQAMREAHAWFAEHADTIR